MSSDTVPSRVEVVLALIEQRREVAKASQDRSGEWFAASNTDLLALYQSEHVAFIAAHDPSWALRVYDQHEAVLREHAACDSCQRGHFSEAVEAILACYPDTQP